MSKSRHRYFSSEFRADFDDAGSSSRGDRHPRGLKGREIGLWYSRRNAERAEKYGVRRECELGDDGRQSRREARANRLNFKHQEKLKKPLGSVLISERKKENINKLLNETASIYPSTFLMKTNSYEHLEETDFKHEFLQNITGNILQKLETHTDIESEYKNEIQDKMFLEELEQKKSSAKYKKMQGIRKKLPSMAMKDKILDLINKNQIVVISGETGCGKTTQVAQFILDDYITKLRGSECRVMCTQPRRISAIAVAERVAQERDEKLGHSVGFQIRLEKTMPRERASILFCTTGVLLKYMESGPSLSNVSHLILDEIHERNVPSDFLITLLKDVIRFNSEIKIILMSATLNSEAFSSYYNNAPHINIPGFTYPVEEYFLEDAIQVSGYKREDTRRFRGPRFKNSKSFMEPFLRQLEAEGKYDRRVIDELRRDDCERFNAVLIFELINALCNKDNDDGAILVFVPGFENIRKICELLRESKVFPTSKYIIISLHSQLPTVEQKRIFDPAPRGMRKIIVSTSIAETSITIDDVTTVIDSGYHKISSLDAETGIQKLAAEMVTQANASQRKGRAGRVKPGVCFHLLTKARYSLLDKYLKPEVLRKRLEDVILQLKILQLGDAESFLSRLMDPPESSAVKMSISLLQRLGALDEEENLTPLGYHMSKLPLAPQSSKMLLLGALFSCLDPILSIATSLSFKDAHQLSTTNAKEADEKKVELSNGTNSDHLMFHYAIRGFEDASDPHWFCRKYYLSSSTLKLLVNMRRQLAQQLFEMKFISDGNPRGLASNRNSENTSLIKAIVTAGLYPNVAILKKIHPRNVLLTNVFNEPMVFHPKSILCFGKSFPSPLFVYQIKIKSTKLFVHDGTVVFPLSIIFFGDQFRIHSSSENEEKFNGVSVSDMRFLCSESTALVIQMVRDRLNHILDWKLSHPGSVDWTRDNPEIKLLRMIMDLVTTEDSENMDLSDYEDV